MAALPVGAIALWPYAAGTEPNGFTWDTDYNGRYLQGGGAGYTGPANGGATSHLHTANVHGHTGNSHTHDFSAAAESSSTTISVATKPPTATALTKVGHGHTSQTSSSATITYQSTVPTISSVAAHPPYIRCITLTPDDDEQYYPAGAIAFGDDAGDVPTGFVVTDGDSPIGDLNDRYIYGPHHLSGGGVTGGSATHSHTSSHTHGINNHSHASTLCGTSTLILTRVAGVPSTDVRESRHHDVTLTAKALADLSSDDANLGNANNDPVAIKLLGLQLPTTESNRNSNGMIIPYQGDPADLPADWLLCDGTNGTPNCLDCQVKITTTGADLKNTLGSNTHTHTCTAHGHTHSGNHNHNTSISPCNDNMTKGGALNVAIRGYGFDNHWHTWSVSSETPTLQNQTMTLSGTVDIRYRYRTVVYIKYVGDDDSAEPEEVGFEAEAPFPVGNAFPEITSDPIAFRRLARFPMVVFPATPPAVGTTHDYTFSSGRLDDLDIATVNTTTPLDIELTDLHHATLSSVISLEFTAKATLLSSFARVGVTLVGDLLTLPTYAWLFEGEHGQLCQRISVETLEVPAEVWNSLFNEGGSVTVRLFCSSHVQPCNNSYVWLNASYQWRTTTTQPPYIGWVSHTEQLAHTGLYGGTPGRHRGAWRFDQAKGQLICRTESMGRICVSGAMAAPMDGSSALGDHPGKACLESITSAEIAGVIAMMTTSGKCVQL